MGERPCDDREEGRGLAIPASHSGQPTSPPTQGVMPGISPVWTFQPQWSSTVIGVRDGKQNQKMTIEATQRLKRYNKLLPLKGTNFGGSLLYSR